MQDLNAVSTTTLDATAPILNEPETENVQISDPATRVDFSQLEIAVDTTKTKAEGRELAKERLMAILAAGLKSCGFSDKVVLAIGCTVAEQGVRINTDFAYNPNSGLGMVWGYSNGGASALPFKLPGEIKAGAIRLVDGEATHPTINKDYVTVFATGYWAVMYAKEGQKIDELVAAVLQPTETEAPESEQTLDDAMDVGAQALAEIHEKVGGSVQTAPDVKVREIAYIDEAPFVPETK